MLISRQMKKKFHFPNSLVSFSPIILHLINMHHFHHFSLSLSLTLISSVPKPILVKEPAPKFGSAQNKTLNSNSTNESTHSFRFFTFSNASQTPSNLASLLLLIFSITLLNSTSQTHNTHYLLGLQHKVYK